MQFKVLVHNGRFVDWGNIEDGITYTDTPQLLQANETIERFGGSARQCELVMFNLIASNNLTVGLSIDIIDKMNAEKCIKEVREVVSRAATETEMEQVLKMCSETLFNIVEKLLDYIPPTA